MRRLLLSVLAAALVAAPAAAHQTPAPTKQPTAVGVGGGAATVDPQAVAAATRADKKRLGDHTPFVLCHGPGDVRPGARIADSDLLAAVTELA